MPDDQDRSSPGSVSPDVQSLFMAPIRWPSLESVPHLIAGTVAVTFVLGVIGSNLYLMKYGVSDFGLLKPKYLLSGCLILFVFFLTVLIPLFVYESHRQARSERWSSKVLLYLMGGVLFVVGVLLLRSFFEMSYGRALLLLSTGIFVGVVGRYFLTIVLGVKVEDSDSRPRKVVESAGVCAFLLLGVMSFINAVATDVFPQVPTSLGGAKPIPVSIILKKDAISGFKEMGVRITPSGRIEAAELLYDSKDFLLARTSEGRVLRVSGSQVLGWTIRK